MPFLQSVPAYKVARVAARIGIVIYCRVNHKNYGKEVEDLLPTAIGAATAAMVGIPTLDMGGLLIVAMKVVNKLVEINGGPPLPLGLESNSDTQTFLYQNQVWQEDTTELAVSLDFTGPISNRLANNALEHYIDSELAREIISIILEEFPIHRLGRSLAAFFFPGLEDVEMEEFFENILEGMDDLLEEMGNVLNSIFGD